MINKSRFRFRIVAFDGHPSYRMVSDSPCPGLLTNSRLRNWERFLLSARSISNHDCRRSELIAECYVRQFCGTSEVNRVSNSLRHACQTGANKMAFSMAGGGPSSQQDVKWEDLQPRLHDIFKARAERVAFVKGDDEVDFQYVADVIDLAREAGVDRVGLLTERR